MSARRALDAIGEILVVPVGLTASLGLVDTLRSLPGPALRLALPLRETGHDDRASLVVLLLVPAVVFALAAAFTRPRRRPAPAILLRAAAVLAGALLLQAASLQLVRQAGFGFDWGAALASPGPYALALGALLGDAVAARVASSDRWTRRGLQEHPVGGRSKAPLLPKIRS
jgi:hypothetical protein